MRLTKIQFTALCLALVSVGVSSASAQNYPAKLIRIVLGPVGNASDGISRLLAQQLTKSLGQSVIVENRATSFIAQEAAARTAPDGYTLLFVSDSFIGAPFMGNAQFDPIKDYTPITLVGQAPSILAVSPSLPVRTVKDLLALAKARPNELNYGSGANGSTAHTAMELFNTMAGLKMVRVPHRGNADAIRSVLVGESQVTIQTLQLAMPLVKSGKIKGLAVTSAQPSRLAPDLPTVAQTLPGYEAQSLYGVLGPANMPAPIVNQLNQAIVRIVRSEDFTERLANIGAQSIGSTPEELSVVLKTAINRLDRLIKETGLKLE